MWRCWRAFGEKVTSEPAFLTMGAAALPDVISNAVRNLLFEAVSTSRFLAVLEMT
jgi:hypothetical protein